jgi:hypothetical protein
MDQGWAQEYEASDYYRPEFDNRERPFTGGADNTDERLITKGTP